MRRRLFKTSPRPATLSLTPLVDLVTITLVFLLRSYSSDPPIKQRAEPLSLPDSTSEAPASAHLEIDVTQEAIYVAGVRAASTTWYLEHDELLIQEIYATLQGNAARAVSLRMDADLSYELMRKVLFTVREAGVDEISVTANSRASL